MRTIAILLLGLYSVPAFAADPDETLLKGAGLPGDGPALLEFVRLRSREAIPADELAPLLKDLASADAKTAEKAGTALVMRGPLAEPALRRAANELSDKI